jgi:hypothetical protein
VPIPILNSVVKLNIAKKDAKIILATLILWLLNFKNSDKNRKYVAGKNIADTSKTYCHIKAYLILSVDVTMYREKLQREKAIQETNQ